MHGQTELTTRDYYESHQSRHRDLVIYYLTPCNLQRSGRGTGDTPPTHGLLNLTVSTQIRQMP